MAFCNICYNTNSMSSHSSILKQNSGTAAGPVTIWPKWRKLLGHPVWLCPVEDVPLVHTRPSQSLSSTESSDTVLGAAAALLQAQQQQMRCDSSERTRARLKGEQGRSFIACSCSMLHRLYIQTYAMWKQRSTEVVYVTLSQELLLHWCMFMYSFHDTFGFN